MRGEKGITLVALVVTIVVLLILAGITITYVLADDGIFGKAQEAAKESEVGSIRDYVSNATAALMFEKYMPSTPAKTAQDIFEDNFPTGMYTIPANSVEASETDAGKFKAGSVTITNTKTSDKFTITFDANGVATVKAGEGAGA